MDTFSWILICFICLVGGVLVGFIVAEAVRPVVQKDMEKEAYRKGYNAGAKYACSAVRRKLEIIRASSEPPVFCTFDDIAEAVKEMEVSF